MAAGTRTLVEGCARGEGSGRQGEGANVQNPEEQWEALETFRPGTHTAEQQQRTGARPGKRMWAGRVLRTSCIYSYILTIVCVGGSRF